MEHSTGIRKPYDLGIQRALAETLALGVANGVLLGVGFTAADRAYGLLLAVGTGTMITLSYLFASRWTRSN